MGKYKLYKNKAIAFLSCAALASTLYGCTSPKSQTNYQIENEGTITQVKNPEDESSRTEEIVPDKEASLLKEYIEHLKEEISEVESYASDKWNSEEWVQKREEIKEKLKTLIDFVFNGKEINGITFEELKTEEKEKIMLELNELDGEIEKYIPDYKERIKNWLEDKSAKARKWLIDRSADLKGAWEDYVSEVEETYQKRKM